MLARDPANVVQATFGVGGQADADEFVSAIYAWNELTQQWDGYVPRLDQYQSFNTLDRFQTGGFYWIDVDEPVT